MYNYVNTILAILEKAHLITPEAGSKLSRELQTMVHQHRYEDARYMVEEISREIRVVAEPWLADIDKLEQKIKDLEQHVAHLNNEHTKLVKQVVPPAKQSVPNDTKQKVVATKKS